VARPLSSRRFLLASTAGAGAMVFVLLALFHIPYYLRQGEIIHSRLAALQRLIVSAYPHHSPETFTRWLDGAQLDQWASPGWNVGWLAPDGQIRWSIHPLSPDALPPPVQRAIRLAGAPSADTPPCILFRQGLNVDAFHVHPLSATDPDAGLLLLQAPRPRFFRDAIDLWAAATLLVAMLAVLFAGYQRRTRRHIRALIAESGLDHNLPPLHPNDTLETWTQHYVAAAARKITEERDLFDALFELLQDGILLLDSNNRILRANSAAAKMMARGRAPLSGMPLTDIPGYEPLVVLAEFIRDSGTHQTDDILLPGVADPCPVSGAPLMPGEDAERNHLLFVMRDLTQLRRLESAGEEYATNVSHELKTPLTLILGYTETLLSHSEMDTDFRERSLRTIERHAKRIIRIVDDLLRLAWLRNEAGVSGIPCSPVEVATVLNDAVALCNEWARAAGIAVETSVPPGLVWPLNSGLIEEAIVNLVKNAILYALEGPVVVRARTLSNGNLELSVTDRGPGLKPDDAQRIFDRFYRADKSRSRASGGSGLGLPIVQQIVEAHHGTARVETAHGAGCTFILEFPPAEDAL
jgi:two-component system, OmpR family, phosphate regulon sensor histidine kinase PhoR